jgi:putative transposase
MCRVLEVSTSGYYAWRKRAVSQRSQEDAVLTDRIRTIHTRSKGTYGVPRIHAELADEGARVGRKRVARLMRAASLQGVSRRKRPRTTVRAVGAQPAPDLVERDFTATGPDRLWVADITYIPTWSGFVPWCPGWAYLSVVEDAWSRRVVGWSMASHLRTELVLDALDMAIRRRRPAQVIHHSDHGTHLRHLDRLRQALPGSRCPAVDGIGRGLLRQRPV